MMIFIQFRNGSVGLKLLVLSEQLCTKEALYVYQMSIKCTICDYQLSLLMFATEYSGFGGQCHVCKCIGS